MRKSLFYVTVVLVKIRSEANMTKLRAAGYKEPFFSLEEGIKDYVSFLMN